MRQAGVSEHAFARVLRGIERVITLAGVSSIVPVTNLDIWRMQNYRYRGEILLKEQSVDWYIDQSYNLARARVDGARLLQLMWNEEWQKSEPHYDICITHYPLWDQGTCYGVASRGFGAVISTYAIYQAYMGKLADDVFESLVMHEVGHVFGLVPRTRTNNVVEMLGLHCTNRCIMRQGMDVEAWRTHTDDRLQGHEFCLQCRRDLRSYFHH
jgi:predicted Zn-dependent protease